MTPAVDTAPPPLGPRIERRRLGRWTVHAIQAGGQKLDGGAMFGNAPKAVWQKWIPADERNRIPLACRCLLVRDAARTILLEAGIGNFNLIPLSSVIPTSKMRRLR